jgi:hypothetical protein
MFHKERCEWTEHWERVRSDKVHRLMGGKRKAGRTGAIVCACAGEGSERSGWHRQRARGDKVHRLRGVRGREDEVRMCHSECHNVNKRNIAVVCAYFVSACVVPFSPARILPPCRRACLAWGVNGGKRV